MQVTILSKYPVHRIFEDAAAVFAREDIDANLCFGVQDWSMEDIFLTRQTSPCQMIAMQSELLLGNNMPFMSEEYMQKLRCFDEVWEYSEHNIPFLHDHGVRHVTLKPVLPSTILSRPPCDKNIDVLHFGSVNRHRERFLNHAAAEGFRIVDVQSTFGGALFGEELHNLILRSHVILGLHSFAGCPIQENFRYQFPLSNHIPVLAEKSASNPLGLEEFSSPEEMVETLQRHVQPQTMADTGRFMRQLSLDTYLVEASRQLMGSDAVVTLKAACDYLMEDAELLAQTHSPELARHVAEGLRELYVAGGNRHTLRKVHGILAKEDVSTTFRNGSLLHHLIRNIRQSCWLAFCLHHGLRHLCYGHQTTIL